MGRRNIFIFNYIFVNTLNKIVDKYYNINKRNNIVLKLRYVTKQCL